MLYIITTIMIKLFIIEIWITEILITMILIKFKIKKKTLLSNFNKTYRRKIKGKN